MNKKLASSGVVFSMAWLGALGLGACQEETVPIPEAPAAGALREQGLKSSGPNGRICGGIAGIPCPSGLVCVDDPDDDCDPELGGRDCGGICVPGDDGCDVPGRRYVSCDPDQCRSVLFQCGRDLAPFFDECGCGCEPRAPAGGGVPCGHNVCEADQFCCNASCGICAPTGAMCIQIYCY